MKNKIFLFLTLLLISISCNAQQYPLNTNYRTIPDNSYIKDINNEYNKFVGNWKATINNKEVNLSIIKQDNRPIVILNKSYYSDVLLLRYNVLENNQIVENTLDFTNDKVKAISMGIEIDGSVLFDYEGLKCLVGNGFINLVYIDPSHLKWNYQPQSTVITNKNCSDYPAGGIKINLPYEPKDIIFTKQ
ncbi:hypothetical protein ACM39_00410 [Chryseobacterium sp. FH2]|uniref:DUF6705 family protein n=1 Tax=Chryseobacterium sp. FH2 TaxID=1674291 RepID=UPI00065AD0E8|nr:DUF6705 family protein [Chryseobacterium sp. FH2]KMQ69564.1 hypothetical protein ACM39_00410 [Chryseobacterium sp. FH2]